MSSNIYHYIRNVFFSPESQLELTLRTLYHKLAATRLFFNLQNHLAKRSYRKYRPQQHKATHDLINLPHQPKVTFLLSYSAAALPDIRATLQSIQSLIGDRWEVRLVTSDEVPESQFSEFDHPHIQLAQAKHLNLLNQISGDYVIFCEAGDQFDHSLLLHFYSALSETPQAELVYYNCEYQSETTGRPWPFFKPAATSPALLLSTNYLTRGFIRFNVLKKYWAETSSHPDLLSQEYDIMLRLCEKNATITHIPKLLVQQNTLVLSETPDNQKILEKHLSRQGLKSVTSTQEGIGRRFSWATGDPSLAIIIPTKNNRSFLEPLVASILELSFQGQLSIHIVDNGSEDPPTLAYYQEIQREPNTQIIPYAKPFNYSEAINLGVASSQSDLVLLMNDDMALIDQNSIPELIQWAIRPEVGVVGAKLLRANHTIQHAGIILGMTGFVGHLYLNATENYNGLIGSVDWYRNHLAVTGACQMVRREVFNEVGGYDLGYQLAFGDIDFCVKVHDTGYQNIYTPFAQFYHYEGSSRGYQTPVTDVLRGYEKLENYMVAGDPFFSPNLTYTRIPRCVINKTSQDDRKKQITARKRFYEKYNKS